MRIFSLLLVLLLLPSRTFADERWYILTISGVPVGWVSEERDGPRTRVAMSARLTRLGKSIDMRFDTVTTEEAGALAKLEYEAQLSKQPMRVTVHANGGQFKITSGTNERLIDGGGEPVIGPAAVATLTAQRLRTVDDSVTFAMFSPEFQKVVSVRRRMVAKDDVSPCGGAVANKVEEEYRRVPRATHTLAGRRERDGRRHDRGSVRPDVHLPQFEGSGARCIRDAARGSLRAHRGALQRALRGSVCRRPDRSQDSAARQGASTSRLHGAQSAGPGARSRRGAASIALVAHVCASARPRGPSNRTPSLNPATPTLPRSRTR